MTNRYEMIIRNEADFEERRTFVFTYGKVFLMVFVLFCLTTGASLLFAKYLKSEWFSPEYQYSKMELKLVKYSEKLDSMETELDRKHEYIISFKKILDPEYKEDAIINEEVELSNMSSYEDELNYLDEESGFEDAVTPGKLVMGKSLITSLAKKHFISPVSKTKILDTFNFEQKKYSITFETYLNEPIKVIDDGKVILCNWDKDEGYIIAIEHDDNLVSLYKGNDLLLKKPGNLVQTGEVIALAKNSNKRNKTQLELWHDGNPLDPQKFIQF